MIRKATRDDIDALSGFQLLMAKETEDMNLNPSTVQKGVSAVFEDPYKGFYIVSEEDREVIASLMITYEWSDWRAQTVWYIQSLYVMPEWRKKGIFRAMYEHLKEMMKDNDTVCGIRLYVDKENTGAQKTYEALGMDGEHYRFYEDMQ